MQRLARWGLKLLSAVVPVVLAACYGAPVDDRTMAQGKVQDSTTKAGLLGLQVTCLVAGTEVDQTLSDSNGQFYLYPYGDKSCDQVRVDDVDGDENGGAYQTATVAVVDRLHIVVDVTH